MHSLQKALPKVAVLMSTYNGERFLREQLDSILRQFSVNLHLVIRDDGSQDRTLDIVQEYRDRFHRITLLRGSNIGCKRSFLELAQFALENLNEYAYFAFSDQDDVWNDDKLFRAVSILDDCKNNNGVLYHSCYEIVDKNLNHINKSSSKIYGTFGEALIANQCIGCSMVFDYKVLSKAVRINSHIVNDYRLPYHDVWFYLVALASNARVIYDDVATFKYRQHGNNEIGLGNKLKSYKLRCKNVFKHKGLKSYFAELLTQTLTIAELSTNKELLNTVKMYRNSITDKLNLITDSRFKTKNCIINLSFKMMVLCGLY